MRDESNPYRAPAVELDPTPVWVRALVTLRYIPAAYCFLYFGCALLSVPLQLTLMGLLAWKGIRLVQDPRVAPTAVNLAVALTIFISGGLGFITGRCWIRKRWVKALILTTVMVGALVALSILAPLRGSR